MFNERSALEKLFNQLDVARERRYEQYLNEIKAIEEKQAALLADLRRIDDENRIHNRIQAEDQEEKAATESVKKQLAAMDQTLVTPPRRPTPDPSPYKKESEPTTEKPDRIPEKAMNAVYKDNKKIYPGGVENYQTYYICSACKDRGRLFLPSNAMTCYCNSCKKVMKVRFSTSKGFPHQDEFGNYFIAGAFIRSEDRNKISLDNPVDKIMERYNKERKDQAAKEEVAAAGKEAAATGMDETAIAAAFKESAKLSPGF